MSAINLLSSLHTLWRGHKIPWVREHHPTTSKIKWQSARKIWLPIPQLFPPPPYSLVCCYPLTGKSLSQLSDEPLVVVVLPDPKPDHNVVRQNAKNAIVARDASRAKLVAVGKPFDRLEFDACRVGDK
jgi:hypothetical protein